MAIPRTWLPRAEEIIDILREMKAEHLGRPEIEELYQLQRSAAVALMTQVGATGKRGSRYQVERTSLLSWTERVHRDEEWQSQRQQETRSELARSQAVTQAARAEMTARGQEPISFPIDESYFRASCASLPPSIRIEPCRVILEVAPQSPERMIEQACQLLYELAMAVNNDPDGLRARLVPRSWAERPSFLPQEQPDTEQAC